MAEKNIYQKLIEVRKAVPGLKKSNKGFEYSYVSSSQTLTALRKAMDDEGLLLIPQVLSAGVKDHTTSKGNHQFFTLLEMKFIWVNADNPEEKICCDWYGQGLDSGEKGVGKALTYAEKYFFLKFFNIPTDKDDPDTDQDKDKKQPTRDKGGKTELPKDTEKKGTMSANKYLEILLKERVVSDKDRAEIKDVIEQGSAGDKSKWIKKLKEFAKVVK